jgi:hypothetical protein
MRARTKKMQIGSCPILFELVMQNIGNAAWHKSQDYLRQLRGIRSHREAAGRVLQNKATLLADLSNFSAFCGLEGILVM